MILSLAFLCALLAFSFGIKADFFLSEDYQSFFFGSFSVWLFYCIIEFSLGLSKSKSIESKITRALLYFVPAVELSIIAYLAGKEIESNLFRFIIGAGLTFIFGSIALQIVNYLSREQPADLASNPAEIAFEFMKKNGDRFEVIKEPHEGPVFIQCKAKFPVTVILLIANKAGKPYYPYPTFKADSSEDLLYLKGQPFSFVPESKGKPFKLWIVGSHDKDQLMNFISANDLNWPAASSSNFKTLGLKQSS
jgi:hypothetical protein